ncbi:MAG: oxaloacetate decarboxylase [Hyphomicrobiaceae bacterium]
MADPALRQALEARPRKLIIAPGVFDGISALIADRMGFKALYVTGYGTVSSALGLPDAGLATYRDMVERVGLIAARTRTPIIADADTGYGGLLNVRHTVRGYEAAGVTAIQLEDQEFPKKCGHTPNRRVIPAEDMVQKIKVACDSRSSRNVLIIARTDARAGLGFDEALRRMEAYDKAGADILFIEAPETEDELAAIARHFDKPLLANMVTGGKTPVLPAEKLQELGYAISIYPAAGFLAAGAAMHASYQELLDHGINSGAVPMMGFTEFSEMIGFPDVWEFEKRYGVGE